MITKRLKMSIPQNGRLLLILTHLSCFVLVNPPGAAGQCDFIHAYVGDLCQSDETTPGREHVYQWPLDDPDTIHQIGNSSREFQSYDWIKYHMGIDILAAHWLAQNPPTIRAVADGEAMTKLGDGSNNHLIELTVTDGQTKYIYEYVHLEERTLPRGLRNHHDIKDVKKGDSLGHVTEWPGCNPDMSPGYDHLHFTFQECEDDECRLIDPLMRIRPIEDTLGPEIKAIYLVPNETDQKIESPSGEDPTVSGDIDIVVEMFDIILAPGMSLDEQHRTGVHEAGFTILYKPDGVSTSEWDTVAVRSTIFPPAGLVPRTASARMMFRRTGELRSRNDYCRFDGDKYYYVLTNNLGENTVSSDVIVASADKPMDGYWHTAASEDGQYRIDVHANDVHSEETSELKLRLKVHN
jgi:hypothetical protein